MEIDDRREHQRQGFGRAAMHEVFDWVREQEWPRVFTSVLDGNVGASRFYESFGYAFTGRSIDGEAEMHLQLADVVGQFTE